MRKAQERRPTVPAYGGSGILPTYFSGSAARSDVPYSRGAKIVGFLIALGLILLLAWFFFSAFIRPVM